MLPVIICDPVDKQGAPLLDALRALRAKFNLLIDAHNEQEARRFLEAERGIVLAIDNSGALLRQAIEQNKDSYLVLLLKNMLELEDALDGSYRLSGALVKPVRPDKAMRLLSAILADYQRTLVPDEGALVLSAGGSAYRLRKDSILYIEAIDKKLDVYTERQCLSVYESMGNLQVALGDGFLRCHRSYMVNLGAIEFVDWTAMELRLGNGVRLPISRGRKQALKDAMRQWMPTFIEEDIGG